MKIRLTEKQIDKIKDAMIIEDKEKPESNIAKKVDFVANNDEFVSKIDNIYNSLNSSEQLSVMEVLLDLGIDQNSSAEEVKSKIEKFVNKKSEEDVNEGDDGEKINRIKNKVGEILFNIGVHGMKNWGKLPIAILINSFTNMPIGSAAVWSVTSLLLGLAKVLGHDNVEANV